MRIVKALRAGLMVVAVASAAPAAQIVDWSSYNYVNVGGDGVTLNRTSGLLSGTGDIVSGSGVAFDVNTPLNPTSGYSDPSSPAVAGSPGGSGPKNTTFYGGFAVTGAGSRGADIRPDGTGVGIRDNGVGDTIVVRYGRPSTSTNTGSNTIGMAIVFKKSDFLTGSSQTLSLDSTSVFSLSAHQANNADSGRERVIVNNGGSWYIGTSTVVDGTTLPQDQTYGTLGFGFNIDSTGDYPLRKLQFSNIVWKQYDPFTSVLMDDAAFAAAPTYAGSFSDIQAVGAYVQSTANTGSGADLRAALSIFRANVTVTPEPASLTVIAGVGMLALRRRRLA